MMCMQRGLMQQRCKQGQTQPSVQSGLAGTKVLNVYLCMIVYLIDFFALCFMKSQAWLGIILPG